MLSAVKTIPAVVSQVALNPRLAIGELRKYGVRANARLHDAESAGGVDVVAEDWDNLLILDGCRYDMYAASDATPDGHLRKRLSRASTSQTFIERNFNDRDIHDAVYVTANPFVKDLDDDVFHAVYNVFDEWDDDLQTVPPEAVADAVRDAHENHPEKRIVGHFMQPHYPFIGEQGRSLRHRGYSLDADSDSEPSVWAVLQYGYSGYEEVTEDRVWVAYRENLDVVLDTVVPLLDDLVGRTVITADHGNLVGERLSPIPVKAYGHPRGIRAPELVEVPWHVHDTGDRKTVLAENPVGPTADTSLNNVDARLEALGYR